MARKTSSRKTISRKPALPAGPAWALAAGLACLSSFMPGPEALAQAPNTDLIIYGSGGGGSTADFGGYNGGVVLNGVGDDCDTGLCYGGSSGGGGAGYAAFGGKKHWGTGGRTDGQPTVDPPGNNWGAGSAGGLVVDGVAKGNGGSNGGNGQDLKITVDPSHSGDVSINNITMVGGRGGNGQGGVGGAATFDASGKSISVSGDILVRNGASGDVSISGGNANFMVGVLKTAGGVGQHFAFTGVGGSDGGQVKVVIKELQMNNSLYLHWDEDSTTGFKFEVDHLVFNGKTALTVNCSGTVCGDFSSDLTVNKQGAGFSSENNNLNYTANNLAFDLTEAKPQDGAIPDMDDAMLAVTLTSGGTFAVGNSAELALFMKKSRSDLEAGQSRFILVSSDTSSGSGLSGPALTPQEVQTQGGATVYRFEVGQDYSDENSMDYIYALFQGGGVSPADARTYFSGPLAVAAQLGSRQNLLIDRLISGPGYCRGWFGFGTTGGSSRSLGTEIGDLELDAWHLAAGLGYGFEGPDWRGAVGAYFDGGRGDYEQKNRRAGHLRRGRGDVDTLGGGIMARFDFDSGLVIDGSLAAGEGKADFTSANNGDRTTYDYRVPYWGGHLRARKTVPLNDKAGVELGASAAYTRQSSDHILTSAGESLRVESLESLRSRLSTAFVYQAGEANEWKLRAGIGVEREFKGRADGVIDRVDLESVSFKGNTVVGEGGVNWRSLDGAWEADASVQVYGGQTDGFGGLVKLKYCFR